MKNINAYTAFKNRKQWFVARIGQTIHRPPTKCNCDSCVRGHKEGVRIIDYEHALYLQSVEAELGLRYSDKSLPI